MSVAIRFARDAKLVGHILDAANPLGDILGAALLLAAWNRAAERHLALADLHRDLGCVEHRIVGHAVANLFTHAIVGSLVTLGAAARVRRARALVLPPVAAALAARPCRRAAVVAVAILELGAGALRFVAPELVALLARGTEGFVGGFIRAVLARVI